MKRFKNYKREKTEKIWEHKHENDGRKYEKKLLSI